MSETRTTTPAPLPQPVAAADTPDATRVVTLFVLIVAILYFGKEVLVPVTLALLLAFLLAPLVGLLRRAHLGRTPSVLLGVIVALGLVLAIGGVIGSQIAQLTTGLPQYVSTIETKVDRVKAYTIGRVSALADKIGTHAARTAASGAPSVYSGAASHTQAPAQAAAVEQAASPVEIARRYLGRVLSPVATLGIVFIVAVFALLQQEDLRDRLIRLLGSDDLHRMTVAIDDGGKRLSKHFLTQLSINSASGVVIGLGLLMIGVPNPVLFAILTGVKMVCIAYLDITGSPAHLRYLIQRLRVRLPKGTPILVGLWPVEDSTLTNRAIQAQIGVDYFISSLQQAVGACADAAVKSGGNAPVAAAA